MKRISKIMASITAGILVLLTASCSVSKQTISSPKHLQKEIVGMWYDENDRTLDVQSDGTYVLSGDYGSGTWKVLDDEAVIRFTDFYGTPTDVSIASDQAGEYVIFGTYGKYYKNAYPADALSKIEQDSIQNTGLEDLDKAIEFGRFSGGLAWFDYVDKNDVEYSALINKKGEVVFKTSYTEDHDTRGGIAFYTDDDHNCSIINSEGKRLFSMMRLRPQDGVYYEMFAMGLGYAMIFKQVTDIESRTNYAMMIDKEGNTVFDWTEIGLHFVNDNNLELYDAGNNIMGVYRSNGLLSSDADETIMFIDRNTNQIFDETVQGKIQFSGNSAFAVIGDDPVVLDTRFQSQELEIDADSFYTLNGCLIYIQDDYYHIKSIDKDIVFSDYSEKNVRKIYSAGDAFVASIRGIDGREYYTVIDENGNSRFQPIAAEIKREMDDSNQVVVFDDCIIAQTDDVLCGFYSVNDGEMKKSLEGYDYITHYSDGVAETLKKVDGENKYCYVTLDGVEIPK